MRYKDPYKLTAGELCLALFYTIIIIGGVILGIWYTWLDISTKLAVRNMVKQQQAQLTTENTTNP